MSVHFKNKLSQAWARIMHKDRLHSLVFESTTSEQKQCTRLYGGMFAGPLYTQTVPYDLYTHQKTWLEAHPIRGDENRYRIYQHLELNYSNNADTGLAPRLGNPSPDHASTPIKGVLTKEQVIQFFAEMEEEWLKTSMLPLQKQPRAYRKQPRLQK